MAVRTGIGSWLSRITGPTPGIGAATCWFRLRAGGAAGVSPWSTYSGTTYYAGFDIEDDKNVFAQGDQGAGHYATATLFVADDDVWYFGALTFDGVDVKLRYLTSGATDFQNFESVAAGVSQPAWDLAGIGVSAFAGGDGDIEVAALKVWDGVAPPDSQLRGERLYRNPQSNLANVWGTYHLKSGALGTDSSGNGRTLTATGTPSFAADPVDILGDDPVAVEGSVGLYAPSRPAGALQ